MRQLFLVGLLSLTGFLNAGAQTSCNNATNVTSGNYTAAGPETWYKFTPASTGLYTITTCGLGNSCNTKIWVYDYCTNLNPDTTNIATIYYGDNDCGLQSEVHAHMVTNHTYYIRIGDAGSNCAGTPINWSLGIPAVIVGCTDTTACNFNPFTTNPDNATCIYYPSPLCPLGSDLVVDSNQLSASLYIDSITDWNTCLISEGCMNGYGQRELVRFDTKIDNVGATDFYAGYPPANTTDYDPIFKWDACHGHWHFKDYAEYLLVDMNNKVVPMGYKNGFCVLDLSCSTGSGKFGCNNMGITSGCADTYHAYLNCQWVDITDLPSGSYKLILRANWQPRPDFYGRYETDYFNNWARACITINPPGGANNQRSVTVTPNCAPYYDCEGVINGLSEPDCENNCNGTRLTGDVNQDEVRNNTDIMWYLVGAINSTIPISKCNDLNDDGDITVVDAALISDCVKHGPGAMPLGHSHISCKFPNKIVNPFQHATFTIGNIDYNYKTVDIMMTNTDANVLGYQLKMKGLTIASVQNLLTGYSADMYAKPSGEIISLSNDEIAFPMTGAPTACLRISYTTIDSNFICIADVVDVVNSAVEEIDAAPGIPACVPAIPSPLAVGHVSAAAVNYYLYPNPFEKSTTLSIPSAGADGYDVTLYDLTGRAVRSYPGQHTPLLTIDRDGLSSGLYLLNVTGKGWSIKEKLEVR